MSGLPTGDCDGANGDDATEGDDDEDDDDEAELPASTMKLAAVVGCRVGDVCLFVRCGGLIKVAGEGSTPDVTCRGHD